MDRMQKLLWAIELGSLKVERRDGVVRYRIWLGEEDVTNAIRVLRFDGLAIFGRPERDWFLQLTDMGRMKL